MNSPACLILLNSCVSYKMSEALSCHLTCTRITDYPKSHPRLSLLRGVLAEEMLSFPDEELCILLSCPENSWGSLPPWTFPVPSRQGEGAVPLQKQEVVTSGSEAHRGPPDTQLCS